MHKYESRLARIIEHRKLAEQLWLLKLEDELLSHNSQPGHFFMLEVPGFTLKRPFAVAWVEPENNIVWCVYRVVGQGTAKLTKLAAESYVTIQGPLGNAFNINNTTEPKIVLVGGIGIAPGAYLANELAMRFNKVSLLFGVRAEHEMELLKIFPFTSKLKVQTAIEVKGEGTVLDLLHKNFPKQQADFFACGPTPMFKAIQKIQLPKVQAALEERMACGMGLCWGCVVEMKNQGDFDKYKRVCVEGSVFNLDEVVL